MKSALTNTNRKLCSLVLVESLLNTSSFGDRTDAWVSLSVLYTQPPSKKLNPLSVCCTNQGIGLKNNDTLQESLEVCHYANHKGRFIPFRVGAAGHLAHTQITQLPTAVRTNIEAHSFVN